MKIRYRKNWINLGLWIVKTSKHDIIINLGRYRFLLGKSNLIK